MKDYYKLLEVSEDASPEIIQAAYKVLAKKYHPDIAKPNEKAMKEAKMKEINYAKEILLNPTEREKYNIELKQERDRIRNEAINAKVEKNNRIKRARVRKTNTRNYEPVDSAQTTVRKAFSGFFGLFKDFENNKTLIFICGFLFVLAFLQIFLCLSYFTGSFNDSSGNASTINMIVPNKTTKEDIIEIYGNPNSETDSYLSYKEHAKILIDNEDVVVGWIDTFQELSFPRYKKLPQIEDISIGMRREDIIEKWGYPDTYSSDIIAYYNLIIRFTNNKVIEVNKRD